MALVHIRTQAPQVDYRLGRALRPPRITQPICGAPAEGYDVTAAEGKRLAENPPKRWARATFVFYAENNLALCPACFSKAKGA